MHPPPSPAPSASPVPAPSRPTAGVPTAHPARHPTRRRSWRSGGRALRLALVALSLVLPFAWVTVARVGVVADGTLTYPSDPPWDARGVTLAEVYTPDGGLRPGDEVTAVDGVPLAGWVAGDAGPWRSRSVGDTVTYTVTGPATAGAARERTVPVRLRPYPVWEAVAAHAGGIPLLLLMLAIPGFVFVHRPDERAARALFGIGALTPLGITAWPMGIQVVDLLQGRIWPFLVGDAANALVWGGLLHFALVFPAPRGPLRRRPWLAMFAYLLPFALHAAYLGVTLPGAGDELERLGRLVPVSLVAGHTFPVLVGAALVWGYRSTAEAAARRRMRWLLATFLVSAVLYLGLGQVPGKLLGHPLVPWSWQPLIFLPFPLALGAAVLRMRLFDIEVIAKRSLVYGGLTAGLVVLYAATVAGLSRFGEQHAGVAPYVATALVAVCFQPLRSWLRRVVGRLVFGARDDPFEVIARLGRHLDTATAEAVLPGVVETLAKALHLPYVSLEIGGPDGIVDGASHGHPRGEPVSVPLIHQGEQVGLLLLDVGPTREPFGPADRRLLDALAHHVGITAQNLLLTARLRRSLERLVVAREEERKRLRRDLHDGMGPTLAAETIRIDIARQLVRSDPDRAERLLAELRGTHQGVIADIRRLVEGLRPPVLDQLGLVGALQEHARGLAGAGGIEATVEAGPEVEPLPAAVEVAAYRIAIEALTNVVRHARASRCAVRVTRGGDLLIEVVDDGRGLPADHRAGVGLQAMRERAAELGGTCTVEGEPGGGTTVTARLPVDAG